MAEGQDEKVNPEKGRGTPAEAELSKETPAERQSRKSDASESEVLEERDPSDFSRLLGKGLRQIGIR